MNRLAVRRWMARDRRLFLSWAVWELGDGELGVGGVVVGGVGG